MKRGFQYLLTNLTAQSIFSPTHVTNLILWQPNPGSRVKFGISADTQIAHYPIQTIRFVMEYK
ncbi:MAG: hypothetical protein ABFE02_01365 [Sulfuricella sp.]